MGKSSSQVVGYRYYAKFAAFVGNRIEKLIAINFDNRKWLTRRPGESEPNLAVYAPNMYGENEGGVDGLIDVFIGTPNQQPSEVYQQYLPLVSGYPYQSYLVFHSGSDNKGFYLGNSGYMKEMLLWVKRIHVKNNGDEQWYDEKAEIGAISLYYESSKLHNFTIPLSGRVFYQMEGSPGSLEEPPIESKSYTSGVLPIYDAEQSYQNTPEDPTSTPIPVPPSLVAVQNFFINNYLPTDEYDGIKLPPTIFDLAPIQGDRGTQIARHYQFTSEFYWMGGVFSGQTLMSGNNASISLLRKNEVGDWVIIHTLPNASSSINYGLFDFSQHLESGFYRVSIGTGFHYLYQNTPRPFVGLWVYAELQAALNNGDINPIHKIREIITDDTAMNKPQSDVNDDNFKKAADRIFEEGLGISWAIDEKSCIEAIDELCYHIEAGIRVNRQTGLYEMVLFRDDWFNEDEIHDIAENKIKDLSLEVMNSDDIVNQLNVTYYDRERIKNSTFSIYENGSILTMGHANAESVEFPYFMNMRNAEIVANWKLKQFSTPAWSGSLTTGWREARKWNRYDLIRLQWSSKWNGTILVRIMKINLGNGTDNTVTIDFEEVIPYSGEMNTSIVVDAPVESAPQPPQPSMNAVFEAPYYLTVLRAGQTNADLELSNNPEIGYVAAIAAKPQNNSLNALIYTDGGVGEFEQVSRLDYCDILQLDEPIIETASSFVVTGSLTQTANSNNLILLNGELMGFVSFDAETKVLTVKRGALDTIPKKHNSGDLFVFDLPDVAFDSTQYAQSEIVEAQVLTTTPSGIQGLSAAGVPVEIQARAIRPYPPANVKINGEYYPEDEISSDMTVTWVDRNRLQQTGGSLVGWYDDGVTVETDVEYAYKLYDADSDALLDSAIGITRPLVIPKTSMALNNRLELYSEKNGYRSFQSFVYNFVKSASDPWLPQLLSPTVWIDANTQAVNGSGYFDSATDLSGNGYDLSATGGTIGYDAVRDFKYFRATSHGYLSTSAAAAFNGKSRAWMFAILNCVASVERYIFDIGGRRFEIGAFSSVYAGYILNTHQQESSGYWTAVSNLTRPVNQWHMLLVEVDLNSGFKIYRNGTVELSATRTPSRVVFSNQAGLGLITLTAGNAEAVKCATMLCGYSDMSFDRAKIFGWAAHEYGLTDLLPVDHPYKTEPPMV